LYIVSGLIQLTFTGRLNYILFRNIYQLQRLFYLALNEMRKMITYVGFERTEAEMAMAVSRHYPGTYEAVVRRNRITRQNYITQ
jgi:hypothetical protein